MSGFSEAADLLDIGSDELALTPGYGFTDKLGVRARLIRTTARSAVRWSSRTWGALDMVLASLAFLLAHVLSPSFHFADRSHYSIALGAAILSGFVLFFSYVLGVYDRHNFISISRIAGQVILIECIAMAATSVAFGWLGFVQIGRIVVCGTILIATLETLMCRLGARELARHAKVSILCVGPRRKFRRLSAQLRRLHSAFYARPIFLDTERNSVDQNRAQLVETFRKHGPDELVVMDGEVGLVDLLQNSAEILRSGCGIFSYSAYYEKLLHEVPVDTIDARGVLGEGFEIGSLHTGLAKRPLDMVLASLGLVIGAPLFLICAACVKFSSAGPIIYKQVRVGRYGRLFRIYKFRTMRQNAEPNGPEWAQARDLRTTRVGAVLRKTRLDELPQLWNILKGDMSLVGPRPERSEFVEGLRCRVPHYNLRHLVPPGLTGWAQVKFRYGSSVADAQRKLAFDLYYVRHCSLAFDIAICLRTLAAVMRGAR